MVPAPSRRLQIACAIVALFGFTPWTFMFSGTVLNAIESERPLAMSVAAWLVLLVPLWVVWFALVAWRERNATVTPAVLMALPALIIAGLHALLPLTALLR
jgi:hypothetical protein